MNRERCKELLPIMQAFAEGKIVQSIPPHLTQWNDDLNPLFDCDETQFRIKPEEKTGWINIYNSHIGQDIHATKELADLSYENYTNNIPTHNVRIACIQITYTEGEGLGERE